MERPPPPVPQGPPANAAAANNNNNSSAPPPLPARPNTAVGVNPMFNNSFASYGTAGGYGGFTPGYGAAYSPFNAGMMGGYGNSVYPGYGGSYGGYGANNYGSSNFFRVAEEGGRGALQNVETMVHMFTSISNMLESSLQAVYSSFHAIIGVAEQFTNLKHQLISVLSTLSALRFIRWLFRKVLIAMRLRPANFAAELYTNDAWNEALMDSQPSGPRSGKSSMASLGFLAVALGGPWLIYKLISKIVSSVEEQRKWTVGESSFYEAHALYDFNSVQPNELSVASGETIRIAPKDQQPRVRGWLLGCSVDGQRVGLVPMNYVNIVANRPAGHPLAAQAKAAEPESNEHVFNQAFQHAS